MMQEIQFRKELLQTEGINVTYRNGSTPLVTRVIGTDKQIVSIDDDLQRYSHNDDGKAHISQNDLIMWQETQTNDELIAKHYPNFDTWGEEYKVQLLRFIVDVRKAEGLRILTDARLSKDQ